MMSIDKTRRVLAVLLLALASIAGRAAVGDPVDWYLTVTFDNWATQSSAQFVESGTANVYTIDSFTTTGDFNFGVRNSSWSTQYGWSQSVDAVGQAFTIANTGQCNGWASIPAGTYDVTVNLSALTIRFDTHSGGSGGGSSVSSTFVRGADISWCTEMEADGKKFYNANGVQTDIFALMKEIGMNAIRLRVWVNPSRYGYGAWCDKADVVAKAKRAAAQGLNLMIDFHYSDFFADPSTQTIPKDWNSYKNNITQMAQAVSDHTLDVLNALKDEGITPKWVQVGNETNTGMLWDMGKAGSGNFSNYATLSNAGYDAVKQVFPNAIVIVHVSNAYDTTKPKWLFSGLINAGGKVDMIGLSHYPDSDNWNSTVSGKNSNPNAVSNIQTLASYFNLPVMIVETGFDSSTPALAKQVMQDLFDRVANVDAVKGIFYWEPEVYDYWKPSYYNTNGWNAYNMGAFTSSGKPSQALDPFMSTATSEYPSALAIYDESGASILGYLNSTAEGVYSGTLTSTADWLTFQVVDEDNNVWYHTDADDFWTITTSGDNKFWLGAYGTYTITVDLTAGTWSYTRQEEDTDNWYLYSYENSWEFDKPFTQSATDSDVFTIENFTVTGDNLDTYGGLSFKIISANWAESYSYNANVSATGSYTLLASGGSDVWSNIYATVFQPGVPYTLTWNRATHVLTIAGPAELTLDAASAEAPTHSAGYYNVRATLHLAGGKWNMVCLPFDLDEDALYYYFGDNVKLAAFTDATRTVHSGAGAPRRANSTTGIAEFTTCTGEGLAANTPYLLNPSDDVESLSIDNKWVEASEPATVTQGSYSLVGTNAATAAVAGNYFIDSEGEFTQATGGETIGGMSAYFASSGGTTLAGEGLAISIDNVVTGIRDITAATRQPADGRVYDTLGHCVGTSLDGLPAGIYITGGRKVAVTR